MPTADLLDFDSLLAPIPGDNPAGANLDYELRRRLDEMRTEFDPSQYQEGSPEREQPKREANWGGIAEQTKQTLTRKSKHILYAARLVEAMAMLHSFAGVRDGMKLLRLMVTDCWDRMNPPIEEPGDEAARIAQLNWLADPTSGAFYPTKIRKMTLFTSGGEAMTWQSWKDGVGNFEAAVDSAATERCQLLVEDISAALDEMRALQQSGEARAPQEPPELGEIGRALTDCLDLAKKALARKEGSLATEGGVAIEGAPGEGGGGAQVMSREGIYRQVEQLANFLERLEPHSPVPMLLRKAITLGPMRFHELVEALTKDSRVLDFLKPPEESQ
jgi:type VI secretion system protein ImpA